MPQIAGTGGARETGFCWPQDMVVLEAVAADMLGMRYGTLAEVADSCLGKEAGRIRRVAEVVNRWRPLAVVGRKQSCQGVHMMLAVVGNAFHVRTRHEDADSTASSGVEVECALGLAATEDGGMGSLGHTEAAD